MSSVAFTNVMYAYPEEQRAALDGIDWEVNDGEFVVVAGPSGSGKSTLLRCLNGLVPHFSGGRFGGEVSVRGLDTRLHGPRVLSRDVGFVFQDPEAQLVTGRVEDEIAFGMEQLGVPLPTMRKRVEEMLDLLGIAALRNRDTATLSGGERQRVAVASALALQPRLLALDEPTSQLDPWGAEDVLSALTRLNDDLGLTVILVEHRLERVVGHADRMRVLQAGTASFDGAPRDVLAAMDIRLTPPLIRLARAVGWQPLPLTVKEGRQAVAADGREPASPPPSPDRPEAAPILRLERVSTGYGRRAVLHDLNLEVRPGELVALMGRNGSGKTTLLRAVIGFHRPVQGRIVVADRDTTNLDTADLARDVGYLPQNPNALLFSGSVRDELRFTLAHHPNGRAGRGLDPESVMAELGLADLAERNPHDLSAGERERAALASILVAAPPLLLLDEPTRGMDAARKRTLGEILTRLRRGGVAVVLATHDVEMVAEFSTRVILLGDGDVIADGTPREVLSGSLTYATQINKLYGDGFLTVEDVLTGLPTS